MGEENDREKKKWINLNISFNDLIDFFFFFFWGGGGWKAEGRMKN